MKMRTRITTCMLVLTLLAPTTIAGAQESSSIDVLDVSTTVSCSKVEFALKAPGDSVAYDLTWNFGDDIEIVEEGVGAFPYTIIHDYLTAGTYTWSLSVTDGTASKQTGGTVTIEGLSVTLMSDPFPPLLDPEGDGVVNFKAQVEGGTAPFIYTWDLNGDGVLDESGNPELPGTARYTYTDAGKVIVQVKVVDYCDFSATDTLPVLLESAEDDEEGANECHPVAQKIADGVNQLYPDQAETLYTCEDIYDIFVGGLTDSQVGFGILNHAIKLAESIEDLTWEEIRDWHLDGTGWGLLAQLDRYADELSEVGITDLLALVEGGEFDFSDIRTALRYAVRYDTDFGGVLTRLADGASPGEIGQLYRTAQELGVDPTELDAYLAEGVKLSDVKHAAKSAEQIGVDWFEILDAYGEGNGWGDIKQAYQLADENTSAEEILAMGVQEYRKLAREEEKTARQDEKNQRTASQIANKNGVSEDEVWSVYEGVCGLDWGCVRKYYQKKK